MPSSTCRARLVRCFMSTDLAEFEFEDGSRRLIPRSTQMHIPYEGCWGVALLGAGPRLIEFSPDPGCEPGLA